MKKAKFYVEVPFLDPNTRMFTFLCIGSLLFLSWNKYDFDICETEYIFPKKQITGSHIFTIGLALFNLSIKLTCYRPKQNG